MALKNPLGPVGETVQANVKRLREAQNLSLVKLSRLLTEVGRPIPTLGLSRIENGERRVDADDLVALAMALGKHPAALLLPPEDPDEPVQLAPQRAASWQLAWRWMHGEVPLSGDRAERGERARWFEENRPYAFPLTIEELKRILEVREVGVGAFSVALEHDGREWVRDEMTQWGQRKEEDDGQD